jgi:hypothetical protein
MPQALQLLVGTSTVVTVNIPLTATQTRTAIGRAAVQMGIDTTGKTDVEIAEAVLRRLLRQLGSLAMDRHRFELTAAQQAALEEQLKNENTMEPTP